MAQRTFINSYQALIETYQTGLNSIAAVMAAAPTPDEEALGNALYDFISTTYYSDPVTIQQQLQIKSYLGSFYNAYVDPECAFAEVFSENQIALINQLTVGVKKIPLNTIGDYINFVGDSTMQQELSTEAKASVLMGVAIAEANRTYFNEIIGSPGDWTSVLSSIEGVNQLQLPYWIGVGAKGAIIGETLSSVIPSSKGCTDVSGSNYVTIVAGALAATFGTIWLNWANYPPTLNFERRSIAGVNIGYSGDGGGWDPTGVPFVSRFGTNPRRKCCEGTPGTGWPNTCNIIGRPDCPDSGPGIAVGPTRTTTLQR